MKKTQKIQFKIEPEHLNESQRVDKLLALIPEVGSRSQALKLIQMGAVRIAGKVVKPSYKPNLGDILDLDVPIIEVEHLVPYDFKLDIVFEDADFIIINKPSGLVVHPACGHEQDTLVNALINYTDDLSLGYNEKRPGIVHRIDKDTSGLLVIAKNDHAQRELALQFQKKTSHRIYYAICFGIFKNKTGRIESFLRRHPEDRKRMISSPTEPGKLAITHYKVLEENPNGISLVQLKLETGRTHQIRAHLSELGYPIVGDEIYGGKKRTKNLKSLKLRKLIEEMPRFALHAAELGFKHPRIEKTHLFKSAWPEDLKELVEQCGFSELSKYESPDPSN